MQLLRGVGRKVLNVAAFTDDLLDRAKAIGIKSAEKYKELARARAAAIGHQERLILDAVTGYNNLDASLKGKDGAIEPPASERAGEADVTDETGRVQIPVPLQARAGGSACARLFAADTPPEDQYSGTGADVECIGRFKLPGHPTWGEDDAAWFERWKTRTNHECPASRLRFLLKAGLGTRYYICAQCGQVYRVRRWGCTEPPGSGGEPADAN
jgi:hypothetical protein